MKNKDVIDEIRSKANQFEQGNKVHHVRQFKVKELDFSAGVQLEAVPLRDRAMKSALNILRVRSNFVDFSKSMSTEDWKAVSGRLTAAQGDIPLFGKVSLDAAGREEITDIYYDNPNKKVVSTANADDYINWITESLSTSTSDYSLKDFSFDSKSQLYDLTLLDQDTEVDVFKGGTDAWKLGERFTFNSLTFNYAPFFERLVCSNGATARQFGFGANIAQAKFNDAKIRSLIDKSIQHNDATIVDRLQHAVDHLHGNQISLREFYEFRRFFGTEKYEDIANQYFNDELFYRSYGVNVAEKSHKWRSTAATGINAYDFFNLLTWIASHPDKVKMDHKDRLDLQIKAANFLFRDNLDLEDVATPVKIEYPRLVQMM